MVDKRLLLYLSTGFILATVIGTLSHELGHFTAAKVQGFDAEITYRSTVYLNDGARIKTATEGLLITLGGPVQNILTGTIGLLLLFRFRRAYQETLRLKLGQWLTVFLSLFWLRQVVNLILLLIVSLLSGGIPGDADEVKLSRYLGFPDWFFNVVTGIAGLIVLATVFFRFIPKPQRLTFILAGIAGGAAGYLLWFEWAGQLILP